MPQTLQFEAVEDAEWEAAAPAKKPGKASPWDALLDAVADGKAYRVPITSEKELRGSRIGISRRARSRGFGVEFRIANGSLLVKKDETPLKPKRSLRKASSPASAPDSGEPRRRGRPRKVQPPSSPSLMSDELSEGTQE
jgi:hypothetical protein